MLWIDPVLAFSLPHWKVCDAAPGKYVSPSAMGFKCEAGDINRLNSRYRLAKSFQSIQLESYAKDTVDGYSALFHVFLCYSAFEQFMSCCGLTIDGMASCLNKYDENGFQASIRTIEKHDIFLKDVSKYLDGKAVRLQFKAFLSGETCNVLYLAAGIRHIFSHGILTPNAGTGYTLPAQNVCRALTDFVFRVTEGEFATRLQENGILS